MILPLRLALLPCHHFLIMWQLINLKLRVAQEAHYRSSASSLISYPMQLECEAGSTVVHISSVAHVCLGITLSEKHQQANNHDIKIIECMVHRRSRTGSKEPIPDRHAWHGMANLNGLQADQEKQTHAYARTVQHEPHTSWLSSFFFYFEMPKEIPELNSPTAGFWGWYLYTSPLPI